jgi:predicted transcriptional regulator
MKRTLIAVLAWVAVAPITKADDADDIGELSAALDYVSIFCDNVAVDPAELPYIMLTIDKHRKAEPEKFSDAYQREKTVIMESQTKLGSPVLCLDVKKRYDSLKLFVPVQ